MLSLKVGCVEESTLSHLGSNVHVFRWSAYITYNKMIYDLVLMELLLSASMYVKYFPIVT